MRQEAQQRMAVFVNGLKAALGDVETRLTNVAVGVVATVDDGAITDARKDVVRQAYALLAKYPADQQALLRKIVDEIAAYCGVPKQPATGRRRSSV